jgi:hypothetical protein
MDSRARHETGTQRGHAGRYSAGAGRWTARMMEAWSDAELSGLGNWLFNACSNAL